MGSEEGERGKEEKVNAFDPEFLEGLHIQTLAKQEDSRLIDNLCKLEYNE